MGEEVSFMPHPFRHITAMAVACASALLLALSLHAQTMGTPERYSANAINMNRGAAGPIDIAVTRWSTDAQRDQLMSVMMNNGPEKLLDALQSMPRMGYIKTPDSIGWDLHFARKMPGKDGGERIVLMTDRRIGFWEARNQPRSIDYPFTVIELRLNRDGEGEGKMSIATKIIVDKENNIVTLENYDIQPVLLTNIKREKVSH
jgi:hypothetical protein